MGLKADASFLRFVSMGAVGALSVKSYLADLGFQPIELERYCTSNKIWQTKVKRLRLPDLLCVRTGIRFEVRGKSTLAIKMSHAEKNIERAWDAGLRDHDIAAFVLVEEIADMRFEASHPPVCFSFGDLRASVKFAKLGPPKSASEGAERDLSWPAIVPKKSGRVVHADQTHLKIFKTGEARPNLTYRLNGKTPYVGPGDEFEGLATILASVVPNRVSLRELLNQSWDPREQVHSRDPLDRYVAVKSLPFTLVGDQPDLSALRDLAETDEDPRVRLEAAGSLAKIGSEEGFDLIESTIAAVEDPENAALTLDALKMEAILILSEVGTIHGTTGRASDLLRMVANDDVQQNEEVRQAAVWGLGRGGSRSYMDLIDFLGNPDEGIALHSICGFGPDVEESVIQALTRTLLSGTEREQASASEVLARTATSTTVELLVRSLDSEEKQWVLATLGRFPPHLVSPSTLGEELFSVLEPIQRLHHGNWLTNETNVGDLRFLAAQTIGASV